MSRSSTDFRITQSIVPHCVGERVASAPAGDVVAELADTQRLLLESEARFRALQDAAAQAEEQRDLLLREMNHRVKNLFAVASGLIAMSARSAKTPAEMAKSVQERLHALAIAHELVRPGIGSRTMRQTTLAELLRAILAPYVSPVPADRHERILLNGPSLPIGPSSATSVALVLHEIATNAVKYGALSCPEGAVRIEWACGGGELVLNWEECGGPPIAEPSRADGFGSLLARQSIEGQLGGRLLRTWHRQGLRIQLSALADRLAN